MGGDDVTDNSVAVHQKILLSPVVATIQSDAPPFVDLIAKVCAVLVSNSLILKLVQCLERNAALRPKIEAVKNHQYFASV